MWINRNYSLKHWDKRRKLMCIWIDNGYIYLSPLLLLKQNVAQIKFRSRGLNSEFSFTLTSCLTKVKEPSLLNYLTIPGGFALVWFYDISTVVCYLMPIPVFYIYIKYIWFVNTSFRYTHLNDQTVLFQAIQFSIS